MPHSSFSMPASFASGEPNSILRTLAQVAARGVGMLGHRLRLVRPDLERRWRARARRARARRPARRSRAARSVAPAASVAPSAIAMPAVQKNGYAV